MSLFRVVVVDPPWRYRNFSDKVHGAARAHYEGLLYEELARVPLTSWLEKDATVFLWATWPKLEEAFRLIDAWKLNYVTGLPWVKYVPGRELYTGIGFWFQSCSELVLVARRGKPKKTRLPTFGLLTGGGHQFYAPRTRHSEKPEGIQDYVEKTLEGPYLELFARRERPGWTCWGSDLGQELGPWGVRPVGDSSRESSATSGTAGA